MPAIHQVVAGYAKGDAISNDARVLRALFRRWGHEADIFCEVRRTLPELRADARDLATLAQAVRPGDVALLHLSIGSDANDVFADLPCRKVLLFHNITPPEYFRGWHEELAALLRRGLEQARALAGRADLALAVSDYNARELERLGHRDVGVLPLFLDREAWRIEPDRRVLRMLGDGLTTVLFVGRCAPNKRLEDLLAAFYFFQRHVEPDSRLVHAGSWAGMERYFGLLKAKACELRLRNVLFVGSVPQAALNAYYRGAGVFLSMSEHEGFCIPLLEAMAHGVPVLAHAAAAVPETLDGAGVQFSEKRFDEVAEMMGRLVRDGALRAAVLRGQEERLRRYTARDLAAELRARLDPLLE